MGANVEADVVDAVEGEDVTHHMAGHTLITLGEYPYRVRGTDYGRDSRGHRARPQSRPPRVSGQHRQITTLSVAANSRRYS